MEEHPSDPYAFLLNHSKPSLSQDDKLLNCPFAGESETFVNSDTQSTTISSQPVGIIMESPPDSPPNSIEDKYLTPPEHHASDSDKANLDSEWCDCVVKDHDTEINIREFHGSNSGITSKKNIEEKLELVDTQETENVDADIICLNCDETEENEDIEQVESIDTDFILDSEGHRGEMKLSEDYLENDLDLADKDKCEGDGGGGGKRKVLDGNVGDCKGVNVVSGDENDIIDGDKNGNLSESCQDVDGVENCGHNEDVDIRRSRKSKLRGRKRMLPESFENEWGNVDVDQRGEDGSVSGEANVKLSMAGKDFVSEVGCGNVGKGNSSFLNLVLKASELIKSEVNSGYEVDFEETLGMKGIVFPCPRWWPAEGFN